MNHISAFQIIESGNKIQWDVLITDRSEEHSLNSSHERLSRMPSSA